MIEFTLNGQSVSSGAPADTPLLWVIRDEFKLTGTRFGCGIAQCGACTIHLDGKPVRSCSLPLSAASGKTVTTIEQMADDHPLQVAWLEVQVPQCGYCQSGQIMQAAKLLEDNPDPSDEEIIEHMNGNLCRCMAYPRILAAVRRAAELNREAQS
ncbi:MAG: (2Fe-2S)-binding protein [Xanthomonadales bacterium]|nr:(2Fe-2S)-binding protein [Xanthomonadales bacterium]